ncbi:MFS transporter [Saccharopolyspora phatthalungensis]|uniref:Putative MFS family arabinose efflux permease n=1 Tax=Saccharopolyspora phatthalungensis TaxID=664693 RepID=A0A840PZ75_9PSEU|nr:MFS transporter [Saccharopolyspora phatthalungensis]MBB5155582.1 putative MFS family arabinose efflux permease [Saccharopolyspora phatthalungensis]
MPTRPPLVLSFASLISNFDRFAVTPMLVLIALALHVPLAAVVTTASGYFLAYGLSQPLWGLLSDRFGRLPVIRGTLLGAAAAGLVSALAPNLTALIAARVVTGACMGAVVPASLTYVGDTVPQQHRQSALSDLMAASAMGTAMATAIGGLLASFLDWRVVFTVPAVCAALCVFLLRKLPEPERARVEGARNHLVAVLTNRWALLVFGLVFVEGAILLGTMTFLASALVHAGVDVALAGLATATYGLGVWGFSRLVKVLGRRLAVWQLIAIGGTSMFLGYLVVTAEANIATVVVTALLLGGGWSFMHSSLQTWVTSVVPEARGTAVALFASALFLGSAVASAAAGPFAERGSYALVFGVAAGLAVPLVITASFYRNRYQRRVLTTTG